MTEGHPGNIVGAPAYISEHRGIQPIAIEGRRAAEDKPLSLRGVNGANYVSIGKDEMSINGKPAWHAACRQR